MPVLSCFEAFVRYIYMHLCNPLFMEQPGKLRTWYRIAAAVTVIAFLSWLPLPNGWKADKRKGFTTWYRQTDKKTREEYISLLKQGYRTAEAFFGAPYTHAFDVYIHPDRHSLDSTWRTDWKMPGFSSECWMVASGVASRLDVISPKAWSKESCEHDYNDKQEVLQLLAHELVHVYHGQHNTSPDFGNTTGIDWFVEGLATYASGQCNTARIAEIKKAIAENKVPASLDKFWTGKLRYALSGSVVMFLDKTYGRNMLVKLLTATGLNDILSTLQVSEQGLIDKWKAFMTALP